MTDAAALPARAPAVPEAAASGAPGAARRAPSGSGDAPGSEAVSGPEDRRPEARRPAASREAERECEELLTACREQVFQEPARAVATGRRAVRLAAALAAAEPGERRWADLEALAWALRGNAERVAADLDGAAECLRTAEDRRRQGTGDPLLEGRLLDLHATLESQLGRLDRALELVDEAIALYLRQGHREGLARALVKKAVFLTHTEEVGRSVDTLRLAFEHLHPRQDPRSVLAATQCLAHCLHRMGYEISAAQLVDDAARAVEDAGDHVLLLRLQWLKARIRMNLGHDMEVELRRIRDAFLERGMVYDAALACLDLATWYVRQRRLPDLRHLAREMFPIFTRRERGAAADLHHEALSTLILLRETLSSGRAELPFLEKVRSFLERSRYDHQLRFRGTRDGGAP